MITKGTNVQFNGVAVTSLLICLLVRIHFRRRPA